MPKVAAPKPRKFSIKNASVSKSMKNEANKTMQNGLQDALFMNTSLGINQSIGTMLNQVDTLFKNNRWYLVSNMRQLLSQIYVEHGLVQTLVDVPVDDGMRGGVIIKTDQLSEDEIEQLRVTMEHEGDLTTMGQTMKWNRLFGGAAVMIITDQDPATPFEMESLKPDSKLEFRDCDMWELFWSKQNTSDYSAVIDGPDLMETEYYDYYGHRVHRSRIMLLKGIKAPSFIRPRLRGWGLSIVETLVNSINQYLKANNLIFEVLDEFKVDVYKIKNLANTLTSPQGAQKIHQRIQLANQQKNFQNAITMDSEDDFIQKELSFTGIAETMVGIRMQIASDMRMPLTKVFGISAAGFSSGEDDIENYNAMVESSVREKSKFDIIKMIKIRCQVLFGFVPDDVTIEFKPLRVLTSEQQENVKNAQFIRLLQCVSAGHMSEQEFKEAVNKDNLLSVQLDVNLDKLDVMPDESTETADDKPAGPKSTKSAPMAKNSSDFKESEHPRASDGKFGSGGGSGKSDSSSISSKVETSSPLSETEKSAIGYYKGVGYGRINQTIRDGEVKGSKELTEKSKAAIKELDSAISKSTIKEDTTVYRGMSDIQKIRDLGKSGIGQEISMEGYWSTSDDPKIAQQFSMPATQKTGAIFEIKLKKGQKGLDATAGTKESEMILPRGQTYKIIDFKDNGKNKPPTYVLEVTDKKTTNSLALDLDDYAPKFTKGEVNNDEEDDNEREEEEMILLEPLDKYKSVDLTKDKK